MRTTSSSAIIRSMKKLLLFLTLTTAIFANIDVVVSILPEKTFLEAIGGDKVNVTLMVKPGNSPHTYEPKPSQMKQVAKASLYFAIDVEFEKVWLPKFQNLNPKMQVIDVTEGITKIVISEHVPHEEAHNSHEHDKEHHGEGLDPHVWTSPENVKAIAENIYKALVKQDVANKAYYTKNLLLFLQTVEETDTQIKEILSPLGNHTTFMVFHPAWGYFAKEYGLVQMAVEVEGKSPKPKELVKLIEEAKEHKVRAIFTQPEFSDASAKIIADELNIQVIKTSPLAADWSGNLLNIAKAIARKE